MSARPAGARSRCSVLSALAGEPMAGSAADARGWVALEQPGAWGAKALKDSDLDPAVGKALDSAASTARAATGADPAPGPVGRPGPDAGRGRRVLVAHSRPGRSWLLAGTGRRPGRRAGPRLGRDRVRRPRAVVASLPVLAPEAEPHLLVCANGKRDACCAIVGRPVAAAAAESHPGRVWETTHLGGHRFAPPRSRCPRGGPSDGSPRRMPAPCSTGWLPVSSTSRAPGVARCGPAPDRWPSSPYVVGWTPGASTTSSPCRAWTTAGGTLADGAGGRSPVERRER